MPGFASFFNSGFSEQDAVMMLATTMRMTRRMFINSHGARGHNVLELPHAAVTRPLHFCLLAHYYVGLEAPIAHSRPRDPFTTNAEGRFRIRLAPGHYTVSLSTYQRTAHRMGN